MQLVQIPKSEITNELLEVVHKSIFDFELPYSYFRYDLCLAIKNDAGDLVSYALVREICSDTVELAWGGTCKEFRGSASLRALSIFANECLKQFKTVTFQTWNKNHKMLKLGLGAGFDVVGCRQAPNGGVYLILNKERG